jgi:hypothetical protein
MAQLLHVSLPLAGLPPGLQHPLQPVFSIRCSPNPSFYRSIRYVQGCPLITNSTKQPLLSRNTYKMQLCNRIYYSKVYWRLNMFRAAHRSSSGALNRICSLWFIYPSDDRPLPRLSEKSILKLHIHFFIVRPENFSDHPRNTNAGSR